MNDESVIGKIKNALGFGEDEEDLEADRAIEMERPLNSAAADPGDVRTEYEMGHEPLPPGHDEVAESGVTRAPEDRVQP